MKEPPYGRRSAALKPAANPFAQWRGRLVARVPPAGRLLFVLVALMGFNQLGRCLAI
jgi:hypothetical protein